MVKPRACFTKIILHPAFGCNSEFKILKFSTGQNWKFGRIHIIWQNGSVMYNKLANLGKKYSKHILELDK